jgi:hypothetical protein
LIFRELCRNNDSMSEYKTLIEIINGEHYYEEAEPVPRNLMKPVAFAIE